MRQLVLGLCLATSACGNPPKQDDRICLTPGLITKSGDWGTCIHLWSYRLARAPGTAREVADAVVAGCGGPMMEQVNAASQGERLQLLDDINRSAPELALFHVVQARAGHCDFP